MQRELNLKVKLLLPLLMQLNLNLKLKTLHNHSLFRHQNLSNLHRKQLNQGQPLLNQHSQLNLLNLLNLLSKHNLKKMVRKKIWEHFNLGKIR
jgi:hypothetical protein